MFLLNIVLLLGKSTRCKSGALLICPHPSVGKVLRSDLVLGVFKPNNAVVGVRYVITIIVRKILLTRYRLNATSDWSESFPQPSKN